MITLPGRLRALAFENQRVVYGDLLSVAAQVVLALSAEHLDGARAGVTSVLHTWNARVCYHPHAHLIVTGGGLTDDGRWVAPGRRDCLLPEVVLRERFRVAFLARLGKRLADGELVNVDGLVELLADLARPEVYWHAYAKRTLRGAVEAIAYLARYTSRVAFSNGRLLAYDGTNVVLATKHGEQLHVTAVQLILLFLLHVLPPRFFRIRHYGILSPRIAVASLETARRSLEEQGIPAAVHVAESANETWEETQLRVTGVDVRVCPRCEGPVDRLPFSNGVHERALLARLDELDRLRAERPPP